MQKEKRTKCERYSRVVGYIRPINQWNDGKRAEWDDRKMFKLWEKETLLNIFLFNLRVICQNENIRLPKNELYRLSRQNLF
jgi:ribonucleoside-triphosphate reductase